MCFFSCQQRTINSIAPNKNKILVKMSSFRIRQNDSSLHNLLQKALYGKLGFSNNMWYKKTSNYLDYKRLK